MAEINMKKLKVFESSLLNDRFLDHFLKNQDFSISISDIPSQVLNVLPSWASQKELIYTGYENGRDLSTIKNWTLDKETARAFGNKYPNGMIAEMKLDRFKEKFNFVSMDVLFDYIMDNGIGDINTQKYFSESEVVVINRK